MLVLQWVLPALFVVLGIAEYVRPFGPVFLRSNPVVLIIVGLLLAARHGARLAARNRQKVLEEVPDKPLGLDDED